MKYIQFTFFVLILITNGLLAQNTAPINLKSGTIHLDYNIKEFKAKDLKDGLYQDAYYVLIQFDHIPNYEEQKKLAKNGVNLLSYLPKYAYIAKINQNSISKKEIWGKSVQHIGIYNALHKIDQNILEITEKSFATVLFHEKVSQDEAQDILKGHYRTSEQKNERSRLAQAHITADQALTIARHPMVSYLTLSSNKFDALIEENIETARAANAKHNLGLNLSGNGINVSVGDGGTIYSHLDLNDRLQNETSVDVSAHGSQVAGIIAGEGILDPTMEGYAPSATLHPDYFSAVVLNDDTYYNTHGVLISNNSYKLSTVSSFCTEAGLYDAFSVDIDGSLRTLDEVIHVFASGNDGGITCAPYATGYATVANAWNAAKNTLVVGNTTYQNVIHSSSSRGPAKDGRLKPEIVAVGTNVFTTGTNDDYLGGTGTSFAAPSVSGALALLYEHYKNLNGATNPKGDLMKAVVCNTAQDLGNTGPDYIYGFGALDVYRATKTISDGTYTNNSISNGDNNNFNIVVPAGTNQLKVMLYWHDVESNPSAAPALVNDLDLTITDPSTATINPLVLDPTSANCANVAVNGVDTLNNIEQIVINNPTAGTYTVNVAGTSIPMGAQNYVIVYDIIDDHLALSSPLGGEFYTANESINITWNAAGFDANNFTLEYSLDNGTLWTVISNSISGTDRNYEWNVPSTFTDEGLVRITWNSTGLSTDQSLSNFTIMDVPTSLSATANCDESIDISWTASTGATSYDVLLYDTGSSAWIVEAAALTATTYTDTGLTTGQNYHYTVRATNGSIVSHNARGVSVTAMGSSSGTITTFPYLEGFEANNGDWAAFGKGNSWQWGTPSATLINRAAEGSNCWATNLSGNYNNAELSYLQSPCFDLSSLTDPEIAFAFILDIEDGNDGSGSTFYDYARLEYSTDGVNWTVIGTNGTGHNWYNNYMSENIWDDTKSYWHSASYDIPTTASRVNFRFVFDADRFTNQEGIAIDNILIHESADIYNGANTTLTQSVSGSNWIHFESAGQRLISINPNGNDLGSTTTDLYINTGTLRDNTLQYYLDRNWKITPTTAPTSNVSVRLYLLDSEVETLRAAAGGCASCSTISDAFIAGVTKYSGLNENGVLADNSSGTFSYFSPTDVALIPYANGYYAEFNTTSFSEFYINGGHTDTNTPLPVELVDFTISKIGNDVLLQWETASEYNTDRFEIEVAKGRNDLLNNKLVKLGEVKANGASTSKLTYTFMDDELGKNGERYYRIKIVDKDDSFEYSETKMLAFSLDNEFKIYPNPTKGHFNLQIYSPSNTTANLRISNQLGKVLYTREITLLEGENHLNLNHAERFTPGVYLVELSLDKQKWSRKLIVEP